MTADLWVAGARLVLLGFDWGAPGGVRAEVAAVGAPELTASPLPEVLAFRATGAPRYCAGWYDVAHDGVHVVCDVWRPSPRAQCAACMRREGFVGVHHAHQEGTTLPARIRAYLEQPHLVYVAAFADGTQKIGTVATSRIGSRVSEQGPVAAAYVATSPDGIAVRVAEAALGATLGLRQAVPTARKLRGLGARVDVEKVTTALYERAAEAAAAVADMVEPLAAAPIVPPLPWELPEESSRALRATPAEPYPHPLTDGEHRLHILGLLGTVALLTTSPGDDRVFAADLNGLRGHEIEIGDFGRGAAEAWQPTLL